MTQRSRVTTLEGRGPQAPRKVHILGSNETREEARAAYELGPNDLLIEIVGFSEVDKDDALDCSHGGDQGGHDEAR